MCNLFLRLACILEPQLSRLLQLSGQMLPVFLFDLIRVWSFVTPILVLNANQCAR